MQRFAPLLLLLAACSSPMQSAWQSYALGDVDSARQTWVAFAEGGDAEAQFMLGLSYDEEGNPAEAARWYECSANQGHAAAENNLGLLYYEGRGVEQSIATAKTWFERSAEHGFARAHHNLGVLMLFEEGNEQHGVTKIHLAAEKGDSTAQRVLGAMTQSEEWLTTAAEQGDERAMFDLARLYLTREQHSLARKWMTDAAEAGFADAQCALGYLSQQGIGGHPSARVAALWYESAARQGHATAQARLGQLHLAGTGAPQDDARGAHWLHLAAEQGMAHAQHDLGLCYLRGTGVLPDDEAAAEWIRLAAEAGLPEAQRLMGKLYEHGRGVAQDDVAAFRWHLIARTNPSDTADLRERMLPYQLGQAEREANAFLQPAAR